MWNFEQALLQHHQQDQFGVGSVIWSRSRTSQRLLHCSCCASVQLNVVQNVYTLCVLRVYSILCVSLQCVLCSIYSTHLVPPQLVLQFLQTLFHFLQSRLQTSGVTHLRTSFIDFPHLQQGVSETHSS